MTHTRPSVTVLVTSHDYGRYLGQAVDSALAQTYAATEVVVVDDGSTDDSREVLSRYGEDIRVVLQPNRGQAAALNAGFEASRGEIVLLLDADDRLGAEAVAAVVDAWGAGVARAQFRVELVDGRGAALGGLLPAGRLNGADPRTLLLAEGRYPATGTTGAAYGREALRRMLPVPEREWREYPDIYLLVLAPLLGRVVYVDRVLGQVRVHGANRWSVDAVWPGRLREYLDCDARQERLLREWGGRIGLDVPADWALAIPGHLQARLASLRWDPERHPRGGDRRARLAWRGAAAALRAGRVPPLKRVAMAGWFLALAAAPRRLVPRVVALGFGGRTRSLRTALE